MNKSSFQYKVLTWLPVLIWCFGIFYVSSYKTAVTSSVPQEDFLIKKLAHILVYAILAVLTFRAFVRSGYSRMTASYWAILFVFFYGGSDEIHQRFVLGRESRFRDVVIDTIGASLAILALWKLLPQAPQKLKNWARRLELL